MTGTYRIVESAIDPGEVIASISGPDCGAIALFIGTVREENEGRRVLSLEYEAYAGMAQREMAAIGESLCSRLGPCRVAMIHRTGKLALGEISVVVAVAAPHRASALQACREGIEALKERVPIWKKEFFEGGEVWVEGAGA